MDTPDVYWEFWRVQFYLYKKRERQQDGVTYPAYPVPARWALSFVFWFGLILSVDWEGREQKA